MRFSFTIDELISSSVDKYIKGVSGVYFFKNCDNYVIYVGRADDLKTRLNPKCHHVLKNILTEVTHIDVELVDTLRKTNSFHEQYGLKGSRNIDIYEREMIEKIKPKYNVYGIRDRHSKAIKNGIKTRNKYIVYNYGEKVYEVDTYKGLVSAFSMNTNVGAALLDNYTFNRLNTTSIPKLLKGETIKGVRIEIEKTTNKNQSL